MNDIRTIATQAAIAAGFSGAFSLKIKESPACQRQQTAMPAYDVWVKAEGAARGKHLFTVIIPEVQA